MHSNETNEKKNGMLNHLFDVLSVMVGKKILSDGIFNSTFSYIALAFKDVNFFTTPVAQKILSWCSILLEISALHLRKCIKYRYTSCIWHKNKKFMHMECIRTYYGELFVLP